MEAVAQKIIAKDLQDKNLKILVKAMHNKYKISTCKETNGEFIETLKTADLKK